MTRRAARESRLGDIPWICVSGDRQAAFFDLGRHAAGRIRNVLDGLPELGVLRRRAQDRNSAKLIEAVSRESRQAHPLAWIELEAMARGARVDFTDLILLNVRGDLGAEDAHGCSDLGWTDGARSLLAHNEDADPTLHGQCTLLTLLLDGEEAGTSWWYPGFLPGNTFTVNEKGLVWGLDAIEVVSPPQAPGRGFVARSAQGAATMDAIVDLLKGSRSAGGFAYMIANAENRIVNIESAAGEVEHRFARPGDRPVLWHTNHLCYLPATIGSAQPDSLLRGELLAGETTRPITAARLLALFTASPVSGGVRAPGTSGSRLTLCTLVADFETRQATLVPHKGRPVTIPLADLAFGDGSHAEIRSDLGSDQLGVTEARV